MTNTEYNLNDLIEEIQRSHFSLEYVKILASYFLKAPASERLEISKAIKDSALWEPVQEFLSIPREFTVYSNELATVIPGFYDYSLSEETLGLINKGLALPFPIKFTLSSNGIATFSEVAVNSENALLDKLSSFWENSKKQIAASLVIAALMTPAIEISSNYFSGTADQYSFESEKNYAEIFNDGLKELVKSNNPRMNERISNLSDKEMKFFIKNLETAHQNISPKDKKIIELKLAIESYYTYKVSNADQIAEAILDNSQKHDIDPLLFLSIIKVESDFNQSATNSSGDLSVAQINYDSWSKEFIRQNKEPLDKQRLKEDLNYSIARMGDILSFLKDNYSKTDSIWYARYHNRKAKYKNPYALKVNKQLTHLNEMKMDSIAGKLLDMKMLALQLAEMHPDVNSEKVNKMVVALDQIESQYQVNKANVVAIND